MRVRNILLVLACASLATIPASAAGILSSTFNPLTLSGDAGDTIFLTGTLQNSGNGDLFLNDSLVQFTAPADAYLSADPNFFFENVPGLLEPTDPAYTGPVFELIIDPSAPAGTYKGLATIYGGIDQFASTILLTQSFTVVVAPEPAAALLLMLGLCAILLNKSRICGESTAWILTSRRKVG